MICYKPVIALVKMKQACITKMDYWRLPKMVEQLTLEKLLQSQQHGSLAECWAFLGRQEFCTSQAVSAFDLTTINTTEIESISVKAQLALNHQVNLLGSGLIQLGEKINWHQDYKTTKIWQPTYFRHIEYNNFDQPSDVKFPWELSRVQWLIPVGQMYLLTGEEKYAECIKTILLDWIEQNPIAMSVNWACTMEAAMRIFTWSWFFHICCKSQAWQDESFQKQFLINLFWHGIFTERFIERSMVNGNHFTASAAALVVAGLFWQRGKPSKRWLRTGSKWLDKEIIQQISPDGVNFEASIPYHRLAIELFFIAARFRQLRGLPVTDRYKNRLVSMAKFTQAYVRNDGSIPLWGDGDDARVLPFGQQPLNDHRYLPHLISIWLNDTDLKIYDVGKSTETIWWFGEKARCHEAYPLNMDAQRIAFRDSGFYIMRKNADHIFIDCGPVGLAGRGGHGHNDCLSFTAVLQGCELIVDCGSYLYTASFKERNLFRSTAYHNTPQIDSEEINRFIDQYHIWNLHYDAKPELLDWHKTKNSWVFVGCHSGYQRLENPVIPNRKIYYFPGASGIIIDDEFLGEGQHIISVPLHLAAKVDIEAMEDRFQLSVDNKYFEIFWFSKEKWQVSIENARVSTSYGVIETSKKLVWTGQHDMPVSLLVAIFPKGFSFTEINELLCV